MVFTTRAGSSSFISKARRLAERVAVGLGPARRYPANCIGRRYSWHAGCYNFQNMKTAFSNRKGFTLVEIMIVVAIIALLAAIAVPGFLRARKRSQASRILNDLRMIDSACDQYAIETNRKTGDTVAVADWTNYLKKGSLLYNTGKSLLGKSYGAQTGDAIPKMITADLNVLSDVASDGFWQPDGP